MPTAETASIMADAPAAPGHAWYPTLAARVEEGRLDLPMLPRVATEIVQLSSGNDTDAGRLASLLHQDAALAAAVLRVSNAPAYLPRTPIVSLQQAVTRLGFVVLGEIALAASLQAGVFRVGRHEPRLEALWRHAVASGAFAREIARAKRLNVENGFLCGFLHGIGKPALLQLVADLEANEDTHVADEELRTILDGLHVAVGRHLAERWELPIPVRRALSHYRDVGHGDRDVEATEAIEVPVTAAANRLATHLLEPASLDEVELRAHPAFQVLNFYPEDVDRLLDHRDTVRGVVDSMVA